ncbi:MAG: DUF4157 domain-containing protein, partial [Myxococcota bacterium]
MKRTRQSPGERKDAEPVSVPARSSIDPGGLDAPVGLGNAGRLAWLASRGFDLESHADAVADGVSPAGPPTGADALAHGGASAAAAGVPPDIVDAAGPGAAGLTLRADARADRIARDHGALAVTRGRTVHFREGFYQPDTPQGRWLVAHEAAHGDQIHQGFASSGRALAREPAPTDRLATLPPRIVRFLGAMVQQPVSATDGATLALARRLAPLTDAQLAEYQDRSAPSRDVAALGQAITPFLAEISTREAAAFAHLDTTARLIGADELYSSLRTLQSMLWVMRPAWIDRAEGTPTDQLDPDIRTRGDGGALYYDMRHTLAARGFENVVAFQQAVEDYLDAFADQGRALANERLGRYEGLLRRQRERYANAGQAAALHTALAPAGAQFRESDQHRAAARLYGARGPGDPGMPGLAMEEHRRASEAASRGRALAAPLAESHPLLANDDFPLARVAKASSPDALRERMLRYIDGRLEDIASTRENLARDRELVFGLDVLVAETLASLGESGSSLFGRIVTDHVTPSIDEQLRTIALVVLTVALAVATGGGGVIGALAAGASVGISASLAVHEYEQYAIRSDAYGAQLLSEEPSLTWVVVSILGAGLDLAAVSAAIRAARPALRAFDATGDVAALEARLGALDAEVRAAILHGARQEAQARAVWQTIRPPAGAFRGSFGLD